MPRKSRSLSSLEFRLTPLAERDPLGWAVPALRLVKMLITLTYSTKPVEELDRFTALMHEEIQMPVSNAAVEPGHTETETPAVARPTRGRGAGWYPAPKAVAPPCAPPPVDEERFGRKARRPIHEATSLARDGERGDD